MAAIMALFGVEPDNEDAAVGALMVATVLSLVKQHFTRKQ